MHAENISSAVYDCFEGKSSHTFFMINRKHDILWYKRIGGYLPYCLGLQYLSQSFKSANTAPNVPIFRTMCSAHIHAVKVMHNQAFAWLGRTLIYYWSVCEMNDVRKSFIMIAGWSVLKRCHALIIITLIKKNCQQHCSPLFVGII